MTDYYPVISHAVTALTENTASTRRALYDRARAALTAQLRMLNHSPVKKDLERSALEDAINRVEQESIDRQPPAAHDANTETETQHQDSDWHESDGTAIRALKFCFSFFGRFNRKSFWIGYGIGFLMIMIPIFAIETTIPDNKVAVTIGGLWYMVWLVSMLAVLTKRLHDLDYSGLWLLAFFVVVPVAVTLALPGQRDLVGTLGGIGIICLGIVPGNKGANRFGAPPSSGALPTIGDGELLRESAL
jgi:uncharacterized membrane protein YhaH (DUF805 family)